jgi:hypothetical protein
MPRALENWLFDIASRAIFNRFASALSHEGVLLKEPRQTTSMVTGLRLNLCNQYL